VVSSAGRLRFSWPPFVPPPSLAPPTKESTVSGFFDGAGLLHPSLALTLKKGEKREAFFERERKREKGDLSETNDIVSRPRISLCKSGDKPPL